MVENAEKEARIINRVWAEFHRASNLHGPMRSAHEGYAILKEEVDEAWDEIKKNNNERAVEEMIQVAAMAIRFIYDVEK